MKDVLSGLMENRHFIRSSHAMLSKIKFYYLSITAGGIVGIISAITWKLILLRYSE